MTSGRPRAVAFIDKDNLKFAYRTFTASWLEARADEVNRAIEHLLQDQLSDADCWAEHKNGPRGNPSGLHHGVS
jgi:hypothetical protein